MAIRDTSLGQKSVSNFANLGFVVHYCNLEKSREFSIFEARPLMSISSSLLLLMAETTATFVLFVTVCTVVSDKTT